MHSNLRQVHSKVFLKYEIAFWDKIYVHLSYFSIMIFRHKNNNVSIKFLILIAIQIYLTYIYFTFLWDRKSRRKIYFFFSSSKCIFILTGHQQCGTKVFSSWFFHKFTGIASVSFAIPPSVADTPPRFFPFC